jgi:hypothetical protein
MHDQRNLTQDAVLRAQIAMANRLIAEQSATIARAHSAIERAMETLRGPDGPIGGGTSGGAIARCAPGYITRDPACIQPPPNQSRSFRRTLRNVERKKP